MAVRLLLERLPCATGCAHLCDAQSRRILQRCCGSQPLDAQLAPCDLQKYRALISWNLETVCQQFRHLLGGLPLIAFDLAQAGHGAADTPGKLLSRQVQHFALSDNPSAE